MQAIRNFVVVVIFTTVDDLPEIRKSRFIFPIIHSTAQEVIEREGMGVDVRIILLVPLGPVFTTVNKILMFL